MSINKKLKCLNIAITPKLHPRPNPNKRAIPGPRIPQPNPFLAQPQHTMHFTNRHIIQPQLTVPQPANPQPINVLEPNLYDLLVVWGCGT